MRTAYNATHSNTAVRLKSTKKTATHARCIKANGIVLNDSRSLLSAKTGAAASACAFVVAVRVFFVRVDGGIVVVGGGVVLISCIASPEVHMVADAVIRRKKKLLLASI